MIERLRLIATHLLPFRLALVLIALLAFGVLLLSLLEDHWLAHDEFLIPAVLCFTWSITLLSFSGLFTHIPVRPATGSGWRTRLSYKVQHTTLWLLSLLMVALSGALILLTFELLRVGTVG